MKIFSRGIAAIFLVAFLTVPAGALALEEPLFTLGSYYKNDEAGFKIKTPKGWVVSEEVEGVAVQMLHESGVNINVAVSPVEDTLKKIVKDSKSLYPLVFENFELAKDKSYRLKGAKAHLLGARYTVEDLSFQNLQFLVFKDGTLYVVTGTGFAENWKPTEKFFMKVFKSFKILKK